jgi:hypothetical protein
MLCVLSDIDKVIVKLLVAVTTQFVTEGLSESETKRID